MPERPYETFLRHVMSRALGVPVVHVDDGSRNGMHDAEIHYPDGRVGAVEFTTVGEDRALEMESFPTELPVPSTPYWWTLRYPDNGVQWREIKKHVPTLITLLDQRNMRDAGDLRDELRGTSLWSWYERNDLTLSHYGSKSRGGRVDILPKGNGGVVDTHFATLNPWVESMQAEKWWAENVEKLVRSERADLHLALRVHESKAPFGVFSALWDGGPISVGSPTGMGPITDLWIAIRYGTNVAHWSSAYGWTIHDYSTPNESAATTKRNSDAMRGIIAGAERAFDADSQ